MPRKTLQPQTVTCPKTGLPLEYDHFAPEAPKWVAEGVKVKVKTKPETRLKGGYGLDCSDHNQRLWAGEVGTIVRYIHPHTTAEEVAAGACFYGGAPKIPNQGGDWRWKVVFSHGRVYTPSMRSGGGWDELVRLPRYELKAHGE